MSDDTEPRPEERTEPGAGGERPAANESPTVPLPEPPTQPVPAPAPTPEPATEPVAVPPSLGPEPATVPVEGQESQEQPSAPDTPAPESVGGARCPSALDTPAPESPGGARCPSALDTPSQDPASEPPPAEETVSPDKVFLFQEQQFEIVDIPEGGEESEDGFAMIPPGPTEEVDYDEDRSWRSRRMRRERGRRRESPRAAGPASAPETPAQSPVSLARKYRTAIIVAIVLLALLIIAFVIWYNRSRRQSASTGLACRSAAAESVCELPPQCS